MKALGSLLVIGGTVLLLCLFSYSPSREDKITWGGRYPPPPRELSWKEKWERSKFPLMKQDAYNGKDHWYYYYDLRLCYGDSFYFKMREPVIVLDKSAYNKLLRYRRYEEYEGEYPEDYIMYNGLDTHGESLDSLMFKYSKDKLAFHEVDTFRYGCPISPSGFTYPEFLYMLSRIHYAEVHICKWYVRSDSNLCRYIYFINDNGRLRSFWGNQLGKGRELPDNVLSYDED